ncbi:MAG TPA: AI-2E family transporter [Pirellulales bacterium]|nr:AI-2E family transporter [Pirellulales bacterium]
MSTASEPPIRAELRIHTVCLTVIAVVTAGVALAWLRPIIIPFIIAAFLALALMPLVDFLEIRARMSRTLAACMASLLAVLLLIGMGLLIEVSFDQITSNVDQYETKLESIIKWVEDLPFVQWWTTKTTTPAAEEAAANVSETGAPTVPVPHPKKTNPLADLSLGAIQNLLLGATGFVGGVAWAIISQSVIVLVFLFFLLLSSVKHDRPIGGAWGEMESRIRSYLITMTLLSAVTGALDAVVLSILGVQAAVLFGLLTFLLNFIPNVGSFIATLLPAPMVLLSSNFTLAEGMMAILIPGVIQFVIGNFIQPKLMGEHMQLHPVVILLALIFWGTLWGIVGAFLAVPLTSIIRIACDRHVFTRPVANLMAGRLDSLREEPVVASNAS